VLGAFGDLGVVLAVWVLAEDWGLECHAHDESRGYIYRARGWYIISNSSVSELWGQRLSYTYYFLWLEFISLLLLLTLVGLTRDSRQELCKAKNITGREWISISEVGN
jgi:hypothetical protein